MDLPVIHLGGEKCVTGSCHLFQVPGMNILVDCGMAQGKDRAMPLSSWPVKVSDLDFVFLTHAHVDQHGLLDWVSGMADKPRMIRLVHGDQGARQMLGAKLPASY